MDKDEPDLDRHPWVQPPPEKYTRMSADELERQIERLKERNDRGWANTQDRIASNRRRPR